MKKHEHSWSYVHAVYEGPRGAHCVRRYCACGVEQVGTVTRWRKPRPNEFDESAKQAADSLAKGW